MLLVFCLLHSKPLPAILFMPPSPAPSSDLSHLEEQIHSLCFRLSKADPEDFELDKSSNYDMITNVGMRNNHRAQLLLSTYEVCTNATPH
jgi:hypothetical protein